MVVRPSDILREGQNAVGFADDSLYFTLLDTLDGVLLVVKVDGASFGVGKQSPNTGIHLLHG